MQSTLRLDRLRVDGVKEHRWRRRALREWCFSLTVFHRLKVQIAVLMLLLFGGGLLFQHLGEAGDVSIIRAMYYTWSLLFGEPPVSFPDNPVLESLYFIVPVIGLTVVLEGMVEFTLLLRDRRRSEREWCRAMCAALSGHVIIVGLGRLGYRCFTLLRRLGTPVVVIENDPDNQFLEDVRRDGTPLFIGDGRREALLEDANVAQATSIVLATTNDLANLEIGLDARRINPKIRVVLRMFDQNMADKVGEGLNIKLAMSQSAISAPAFAAAAMDPDVISCSVLCDRLVVTKRWHVTAGGPLSGQTVGQVMDAHEVAVVEHKPGGREEGSRIYPPTTVLLEPGDELLVQGPFEVLSEMVGSNQAVSGR
ncbi:MAG: NAD-binding protein [Phycisphaeraceae bacterium]|nr:MAG: NAD-binding protein [Phycisphaeraceae bacterium]